MQKERVGMVKYVTIWRLGILSTGSRQGKAAHRWLLSWNIARYMSAISRHAQRIVVLVVSSIVVMIMLMTMTSDDISASVFVRR